MHTQLSQELTQHLELTVGNIVLNVVIIVTNYR
jgi:uncharacterized membrane protein YczE